MLKSVIIGVALLTVIRVKVVSNNEISIYNSHKDETICDAILITKIPIIGVHLKDCGGIEDFPDSTLQTKYSNYNEPMYRSNDSIMQANSGKLSSHYGATIRSISGYNLENLNLINKTIRINNFDYHLYTNWLIFRENSYLYGSIYKQEDIARIRENPASLSLNSKFYSLYYNDSILNLNPDTLILINTLLYHQKYLFLWDNNTHQKSNKDKERKKIQIGISTGLLHKTQIYDNEIMTIFKRSSLTSLDIDLSLRNWMLVVNHSWGISPIYDTLETNGLKLSPFFSYGNIKINGLYIGYTLPNMKYGLLTPYAGFQFINIKIREHNILDHRIINYYSLNSAFSPSIGLNYDLLIYNSILDERLKTLLRISYAYSILKFDDFKGSAHQISIGINIAYRVINTI